MYPSGSSLLYPDTVEPKSRVLVFASKLELTPEWEIHGGHTGSDSTRPHPCRRDSVKSFVKVINPSITDLNQQIVLKMPERKIFALLIGINKYQHKGIPDLRGCLNDVEQVRMFLDGRFDKKYIHILKNEQATRDHILSAFQEHLIGNDDIVPGDPILFFFAGHGNRILMPEEWVSRESLGDGMTENICPYDQTHNINQHETPFPVGKDGIPARTINELFRKLANKRGNNITAVFDCCHSGTMREAATGVRTYPSPSPITNASLDEDLWGTNRDAKKVPDSDDSLLTAETPYVLLAACDRTQQAAEGDVGGKVRGIFTNALVPALSIALRDEKATYFTMMNSLSLQQLPGSQKPQCGGENKDRRIFDITDPTPSFSLSKIPGSEPPRYQVDAGQIHGVTIGTEFSVVLLSSDHNLGTLVCIQIFPQSSILTCKDNKQFDVQPDKGARAVVENWNNDSYILKVYSNNLRIPDSPHFRSVAEGEANVNVSRDSEDLVIEHLDLLFQGFETHRVSATQTDEQIRRVLTHIAKFRYHLLRRKDGTFSGSESWRMSNEDGEHQEEEMVQMRMLPLSERNASGIRKFRSDQEDLFTGRRHAYLASSEDKRYGFKIISHLGRGLFPYLFCFDLSDYSVKMWHHPFSHNALQPTLDPKSPSVPNPTIAVGLGAGGGGGDPIRCCVTTQDAKVEKGFVKLFISNVYVNMGHIAQPPVEKVGDLPQPVDASHDGSRYASQVHDELPPVWDMSLAAITIDSE